MTSEPQPSIHVTENGPYRCEGGLEVSDSRGDAVDAPERFFLCRCGGSANKPFCDGTHARIGFKAP
jgi:CDGSH-type Zn-finger protein